MNTKYIGSLQQKTDKKFLEIAAQTALNSKDPSTKVGAVLVGSDGNIISKNYNHFPGDLSKFTYDIKPIKYATIAHGEMNVIFDALNNMADVSGAILYTNYAPCVNCLKHIFSTKIARIVYEKLRVESYDNRKPNETDDAGIIRLIAANPDVEIINVESGKNYAQEIFKECTAYKTVSRKKLADLKKLLK